MRLVAVRSRGCAIRSSYAASAARCRGISALGVPWVSGLVPPDQMSTGLSDWAVPVAETVRLESALVPAIQPGIGLDRAVRVWTDSGYFRKRLTMSEAFAPYLSFDPADGVHGTNPLRLPLSPMAALQQIRNQPARPCRVSARMWRRRCCPLDLQGRRPWPCTPPAQKKLGRQNQLCGQLLQIGKVLL